MLLTSVIGQDPPRQTPDWFSGPCTRKGGDLSQGRGGWSGEERRGIRYGFAGYGHVILVLSD